MNVRFAFVVLALAAVACRSEDHGRHSAPSSDSRRPESSAPAETAASAPPPVGTSAPDPVAAPQPCSPGEPIAPAALSASWPTRIGSHVRFKGHVESALDVMTVIVIAARHRFVVVASPDQLWEGDKERTYTVMGSKTVSLRGGTTLPLLLLEPECAP
jgi:hypothetical protein